MNWFTGLFKRIAEKLGLHMQPKPVYEEDYSEKKPVNLTATIANRVATLTMLDSDATITGSSARAEFLFDFLREYIDERMPVAAEVALGTGDCLVKPWTDGVHIGVDIIKNNDFRVCDSVGNYLKAVIIQCDELRREDGKTYRRFEGQRLETVNEVSVLFIDQFIYLDDVELTNVEDWPESWRGFKKEDYIPNCDQLLFGRYKCPTVNRGDVNSEVGVKVTYGLEEIMDQAAKAYTRFNEEQAKKETMLFVDRTLFKADEKGNRVLPEGKNKLFKPVNMKDASSFVYEFSPDMRTTQLQEGVDVNFRMLEMLAGFSNGVLTPPSTNFATATEMKASLQLTYAFITKFRKQLTKGTKELLHAVDIICNRNNLTPMGDWDIQFDWSSSYIENIEEQFTRLMNAESIGAVDKAEVRSWVMDEDLEEAKEKVAEIEAQQTERALKAAAEMGDGLNERPAPDEDEG